MPSTRRGAIETGPKGNGLSARDVVRRFGHYCNEAQLRPIIFSRHGAPQIVMLSVGDYLRLTALDRRAFYLSELADDDFAALLCSRDALAARLAGL